MWLLTKDHTAASVLIDNISVHKKNGAAQFFQAANHTWFISVHCGASKFAGVFVMCTVCSYKCLAFSSVCCSNAWNSRNSLAQIGPNTETNLRPALQICIAVHSSGDLAMWCIALPFILQLQ